MARASRPSVPDIVPVAATAAIAAVLAGWIVHRRALGLSLEEYRWQAAFGELAARGLRALWGTPRNTWRPLCGTLLVETDRCGLGTPARHALSFALLTVNAALAAGLARRITRRPGAALTALAIALVAATNDELYLWLGGRCDLLLGFFALLGAHAAVSSARSDGRRAVPWSLLAATACGLAAVSKETGLLLPLAWLPLVYPPVAPAPLLRRALASLGPAALVAAVLAAVRTRLLHGVLGPYVGGFVDRGPWTWGRNALVGLARLAVGPAVRPPTTVTLALGLAVTVGLVALCLRANRRALPSVIALATLFAPVALLPADRALYPVVLAGAVAAGVALRGRGGRTAAALALWLGWHGGSSVVMQGRWVRAYAMRAAYVAGFTPFVVPGRALVLVGGRQFFRGLYIEGPSALELPGVTTVVDTCRTPREFPETFRGMPAMPLEGSATAYVLPPGTVCAPTLPRAPVAAVVQRGDRLDLALTGPAVVVYWDTAGRAHAVDPPLPLRQPAEVRAVK